MKRWLVILSLLMLTGCTNEIEEEKNNYLVMKGRLEEQLVFDSSDVLPCEMEFTLERVDVDVVKYKAVLINQKSAMYDIKAMLIHDGYTEDVFPSIGLLSSSESLINDGDSVILEGILNTSKDIGELSLELKIWIEYYDSDGVVHTNFYKSTI